jgi:putative Ca2+/H+ antiporter (TMEM165/GDT1 family)
VPVVLLGHFSAARLPLRLIHGVAAAAFVAMRLLALGGS